MNIKTSSLFKTSMFLAVAMILQGCGEGSPEDKASVAPNSIQTSAQVQLASSNVVTVNTSDFENISNSPSIAPAPENPTIELGAATDASSEEPNVKPTPAVPPAAPNEEGDDASERKEPTEESTEDTKFTPATVDPEVVSENEDEDETADSQTGLSYDEKSIILGSSPGDAVCLHLGDESENFGSVTDADWDRWLSEFHFSIGEEFLAVEPQDDGSTALRQRFIPSSIGTDRVVVGARLPEQRVYRLTQSFYFEPGFDWGGSHEGGKLGFGFAGGTKPTGGTIDPYGFSSRLMWRGNGDGTGRIVVYSYAADRSDQYGEDIRYGDANVPIGEWFTVIMEVRVNSSPHVSDGTIRGWIDGELVLEQQNIGWQLAGDTPVIDYLYYSGFYGGNSTAWSPGSTTHMKTRDVCWAAVVDEYSGIDPDNGRSLVVTTENPNDFLNDQSLVDDRLRSLVGIVEESLINIRSVAPVAPLLVQQHYDEAIAELTEVVEHSRQVTNQSLSVNPVPFFRNAAEQLKFALTGGESDDLQVTAITGVQDAIRVASIRSSELAIAVVDSALSAESCSGITMSPSCSVANDIFNEISSHLDSIQDGSTSTYETFHNAETIWNRSVDALNSLNL